VAVPAIVERIAADRPVAVVWDASEDDRDPLAG
jgi:hypothetical protein